MTNAEYVVLLKGKLESGEMTDRQILEGAAELKRRGEARESIQGKTPHEVLLLAQAIREMVVAHLATQITLPKPTPRRVDRDTYMAETWGKDEDDPDENERLEAEARRQEQQRQR
jgi:hypothetical protein